MAPVVRYPPVGWVGRTGKRSIRALRTRQQTAALRPVTRSGGLHWLHAAQRRSYGRLGAVGFATVLVWFMLIMAGSESEFWLFSDQPYVRPNGRQASFNLFLLGHLPLAIGTVLFGIATVRAKVLPYKAAVMLVLPGASVVVPFVGTFVFAIPFVWLGYVLWSGSVQQPSRVS
jgi:uncharacterized membrane protein YedE/YeeE